MQNPNRHKIIAVISVFLIVVVSVSAFIVYNNFQPSQSASPSPTPTQIPNQSLTPSPAPTSTGFTTPTSPPETKNPFPPPTTRPDINLTRHVGEITQYQGVDLDPINAVYPNAIVGIQYINQANYRLSITGLINKTLNYTYTQVIDAYPKIPKLATIYCVEGWRATLLWEGISVKELLAQAGVKPETTVVIFHASDGYTTALPIDYIINNNIIIAYKMNNVTLTPELGWPFMLVGQNEYGYKWIKWLTEIEASNNTDYLGYWESRGYPNDATIS